MSGLTQKLCSGCSKMNMLGPINGIFRLSIFS
ncbi:hypothetical protein AB7M49_004473 [Bradyrhizobium elkanii]